MRRPAAFLRRAIARWQLGNTPSARDRFSEDGDTLIEVLLSIVVLGIAAVALLTGFATAITASAEHRNLASLDSSTRIAANEAIADVQQEAQIPANNPFLCANTFTPTFSNLTGSFTVSSTVSYWNGSAFVPGCTNPAPQQYTLTVSSTGSYGSSTQVTTVIYDPSAPPPPDGVGTPTQLVWLQTPTSGTVGTPVTPQPEVAVEDALNNIVTSDLSSVTLQIVSYTGSSGQGSFSSTCSGVESYGIVQFSDCSLSTAGTYVIKAVDSSSGVAATPTASVTVTGAPVAKLVFTTAPASGAASKTANVGPITVQEQDAFGNPTFAPETVNLSSSSTTGVFSLTAGGAPVTSVTIPGGTVSSVSFYYGDTLAGTPTITASSPPAVGLASGTQVETINPGPAATFTLSTPSPAAGTAFTDTITAYDQYGNTATGFTGSQCITFSGPGNSPNGTAPAYPAKGTCATGSSAVTFTNGVANPSITLYKAGSTTLTATQGTITGSVAFSVASGTLGALSVANPGTQKAGAAFTVTLTGTDAYGNAFSGTVTPTFSGPSNSPNGTAPTYPTSVTFTNGSATPSVTLYDAQTTTLKVASGAVNGTSTSFTVNAGPFAGFTLSTPTPTAGTAFTETITAGDAYGNGGAAFTGTQCIAFSGPGNSPNGSAPAYPAQGTCAAGSSAVTFNASGVGTASITLYKAGSTTLTATQGTVSGSVTFTVASAGVKAFTIPTTPGTQTAGTAFNVTVDATDTYGNPFSGTVTSATNGLAFSGPANSPAPSNTAPAYPTSLTFTNGAATASVTLYDAQTTSLTVAATGATSGTTPAGFLVNPAPAHGFTLSTPTPTAGTAFNEAITAYDAYSNTATGFTGTECVAFSGPANSPAPSNTAPAYPAKGGCATGQSSLTFAAGVDTTASITLYDAQTTTLTATQGLITGTSAAFSVAASNPTTLIATSGGNQSATVNNAFTNPLVVTATDAYSNGEAGIAVTFTAPGSGASATFGTCSSNPQAYSCTQTTGANGQATSSTFTANGTNGAYSITASVTGLTSATYAEANKGNQTITFTSTAPGSASVGGATYTPTATATSGLAVTITVDASSSGVCSITGGVVSFQGPGTCTLDANQAGNATWNAAPQVQQGFTVKRTQTISFTSTAPGGATVGGSTYTPTATATSGLPVTITVDALSSGVCSITGGVVSFQSVGTCTLDANQAGNATYYAASQTQQGFTVAKGNQTISFTSTAPGGATVGGATYTAAATATSGLTVTFSSGSTSVCTSGGTNGSVFTFVGSGTCVVDANQAGNTNYNAATQVQQSFAVKTNQTISFTSTNPSPVTVGGATYTPTATSTSGLTVAITLDSSSTGCTLSGGVVSFTAVGTCVVDANQAGNTNYNAATQVQQSITVNKGNQTISFTSTNPSPVTVGGATYTPTATSTSGLTVAITLDSSSTGCTLSGGVVSFTAVGTCVVDANQAGNTNYNAATQVQQSITVNKGNQTISFTSTNPSPVTVGGATYTPTATSTSGLTVAITLDSSSTGCTLSGGVVSFTAVGTCKVDANQAGNTNYNAATQVQQSITVNKGNQTISFTSTNPSPVTVGGATYTPTATSTSGLTVAITLDSSSTGCTLSGGVVSFTAVGTCKVDANQAGNTNYNAATQVQQSITVNKGNQTISFTSTNPSPVTVGGATYTPTATSTSGLTVAITLDSSSTGCTLSGGVVSFTAVGTCVVDANQAGNTNYNAATQVQQSITVNKGNQTISFTSTNPSPVTVGGATYTPTATSTSGLTVAITLDSSSTGCTLSGGVVSFTAVGTCVVDANQAGNTNYNAATQVQQSITVNKGNQTISFTSTNPSPVTVGGATYTPTATSTSGLTVAITLDSSSTGCTLSGGVVSFTAVGTCVVDANQAGNTNYNAATQVQQSITVNKGSQTISFTSTAPGSAAVGGATYTAAASATSGLTVTFSSGSTSVCTSGGTNGSVFTFVGSGTCVVDANQAGNTNYNAAPQVQQSFSVKTNQTITFTSTAPGSASAGGATYTPTATATSGLAVTITLDGTSTGCTLSGGVVSFTAAGSCVLDANQAGNATYYAAPQVQQSFAVAGLTITSDQFSSGTSTNPSMTLSGTGATGATSVSVTICTVTTTPCPNADKVATVTTAAGPTNPWTTAATGATALNYATTYYAASDTGRPDQFRLHLRHAGADRTDGGCPGERRDGEGGRPN